MMIISLLSPSSFLPLLLFLFSLFRRRRRRWVLLLFVCLFIVLFVVVDLTVAKSEGDTSTSGVLLVTKFKAPIACLRFLFSISVFVNATPTRRKKWCLLLIQTQSRSARLYPTLQFLLFLQFAVGHCTRPSILQNWRQSKSPRRI